MAEAAQSGDEFNVMAELDSALSSLDNALAQASRSALVIRSNMSEIVHLAETVRELETAIALARQSLTLPMAGIRQTDQPALRPVPPREEPRYEPEPIIPAADSFAPAEPHSQPEAAWEAAAGPEAEVTGPVSHCLRLGVTSKGGSLDLKAVDGSVNENPAVVDVALLDYDGRQATLKLWINQTADPVGVRDALLGSLRRRLGGEGDAEVSIDFEDVA